MSAIDQEALNEIMKEQGKMLRQYDANPKFAFSSCYCIIFYKQGSKPVFAGEVSDNEIVAVYACPLHAGGNDKSCCAKARAESRKISYRFGNLNRAFTEEESKLMEDDRQANRDACCRMKNREILEKLR